MPTSLDTDIPRWLGSKPVHWAWKVLGSLFLAAWLIFGTIQGGVAMLAHDEYTETASFPAAGITEIHIDNDAGSVRIEEAPSDAAQEIAVTANVSDGLRKTDHEEFVEGNRLMLETSCPLFLSQFCEVDYVVVAPAETNVVVRSHEAVTVHDMAGAVDVETVGGRVEVARLRGTVRLHTVDGGITATDLAASDVDASTTDGDVFLDFDSGPQAVRAETVDGNVEVAVPDEQEVSYRVETDTVGGSGDIAVRFDPEAERSIVAKTVDGEITVRYG